MIRRGEVWWADLPPARASEPGFRHPVLIVSADDFNRSKIRTVLCVLLSSNERLAAAPGNVALSRRQTSLPKRSVANVSQLITLDKRFLERRVGRVPGSSLDEIESGLRLVMDL